MQGKYTYQIVKDSYGFVFIFFGVINKIKLFFIFRSVLGLEDKLYGYFRYKGFV